MTQEEKQLLLTDICARLPYHDLWVQYDNKDWLAIGYGHVRIELLPSPFSSIAGPCPLIVNIKPYLRPMSSMTEEEIKTYHSYCDCNDGDFTGEILYFDTIESFDYLTSIHIDYRGLIPAGLALEAPKEKKNI